MATIIRLFAALAVALSSWLTAGLAHALNNHTYVSSDGAAQSAAARDPVSAKQRKQIGVTDTVISNMGSGTGGGIVINPSSGGTAQVALERVTVNGNAFGIAADGSNSTGGINMTIATAWSRITPRTGSSPSRQAAAPIGVMVKNTKSANNKFGLRSIGPNVTVRVSGSSVIGNGTGLAFDSGSALLSFSNNEVQANGINGNFSSSLAPQ
jgi:hypothetical protein